jgi:hydrogenase nickel incorporation protein HypA/HybF
MHEMAIANDLIQQILSAARENKATRIVDVELEVGVQRLIVPEAMELAFEVLSRGTVAEGAGLKLVEIPAAAQCRACGLRFEPRIDYYVCPRCGEADVDLVAGNDIVLKSLSCETEEEAAEP